MDDQDESSEVSLPEDEADQLAELEDNCGGKLTEQEANLAVAQARLIGDL